MGLPLCCREIFCHLKKHCLADPEPNGSGLIVPSQSRFVDLRALMAYPVFIKTDAVQLLLRMNTWVSPRTNLTENSLTVDALMATYWLNTEEQINTSKSNLEHLRQFAEERNLVISEAGL
jgi:hypothetical protein